MTLGLIASIVLHAAVLGIAVFSVVGTPPRETKLPSPDVIAADVISASELNRMRKGVREAKLDEAQPKEVKKPDEAKQEPPRPRPVATPPPPPPPAPPEPPKPVEVAKAEPPPPPAAIAAPEPQPAPDKAALDQKLEELALQKAEEDKSKAEAEARAQAETDEKRKAEERRKAEEERKRAEEKRKRDLAEAKRKAEERRKAEEKRKADLAAKQKQLDASRISALLDKTPDPKQAPAANDAPAKATTAKGPVRGDAQGRDQTISANEASFLAGLMRQQVSRCWNINAGLDGIQSMVVRVEVRLTRDGRLAAQPRIVNDQANPVFRDAAASAQRALVQCEPYQLPDDKYAGGWEHMILVFDPQRMF